jgi:hypothetical protein
MDNKYPNDKGTLKIYSKRVRSAMGLGIHHGLSLDIPDHKYYIIAEWG